MMGFPQEHAPSSAKALDHVRRDLVAIRAGLAEHGPSDPKMAVPWALQELAHLIAYIRAVEKVEQASPSE